MPSLAIEDGETVAQRPDAAPLSIEASPRKVAHAQAGCACFLPAAECCQRQKPHPEPGRAGGLQLMSHIRSQGTMQPVEVHSQLVRGSRIACPPRSIEKQRKENIGIPKRRHDPADITGIAQQRPGHRLA
jgi:hypothetical protein